jgi:hypothetical protein
MTFRHPIRQGSLWSLVAVAILFSQEMPVFSQPPATRLPVPEASAQSQALAIIQELFKDKYNLATTRETQKALCQELLARAKQTKDDSTALYVLLKQAETLAVKAADTELALQTIKDTAERFDVDAADLRMKAMTAIGKSFVPAQERSKVVASLQDVMEEAAKNDNYDAAGQLGILAIEIARRAKDTATIKQIVSRTKEFKESKKFCDEAKEAAAVLEQKPTDADANFTVGRYRCFIQGQWKEGIPMLALGGDATLKALAVRELKGQVDKPGELAVGDGWWQLAEEEEGVAKRNIQEQAAKWYRRSLPGLTGLEKQKLENRLRQMTAASAPQKTAPSRPPTKEREAPPKLAAPVADHTTKKVALNAVPNIIEGVGVGPIRFGATRNQLIAVLGAPDSLANNDRMLRWTTRYHFDCLVEDGRGLFEIHFNKGFEGRTSRGVGLGDSLEQIIRASGGAPPRPMVCTSEEVNRVRTGNERVLFKVMSNGRLMNLRFVDGMKGMIYWCTPEGQLTSITMHPR